jgi:hypothetical protein
MLAVAQTARERKWKWARSSISGASEFRQIEAKALRQLRSPERARHLRVLLAARLTNHPTQASRGDTNLRSSSSFGLLIME